MFLQQRRHIPKMNLLVLWVSILLTTISMSQAASDCTADTCNLVDCFPLLEPKCKGVFIKRGGFCGCCDACYDAIEPGQPCTTLDLSQPPIGVCKSGYFCDYGTCKPLVG